VEKIELMQPNKARIAIDHEQKINSEKVNEHIILLTQFNQNDILWRREHLSV
jgi:hypothetical protein